MHFFAIFRPSLIMERKSSTHRERFFYVYLQIVWEERTDGSEFENFLSLNFCKFAVECDWNSKGYKNVGNLKFAFFWKEVGFFQEKKTWFFFQNR